jgi:molybdopterin converting factor subunit 1
MHKAEKQQGLEEDDQQILVKIKLFATCRELIGKDQITLKLKNQMTVGDIRKKILKLYPVLLGRTQFVVAVNYVIVDEITLISEKDEVAILPAVSGG